MSYSAVPQTLTREQVRELDRRAIEDYGIPSALLMENAGRACANVAVEMLPSAELSRVIVLCGPGNNGGDGFVIARTLLNRGYDVEVFVVCELGRLSTASEDVQLNVELWTSLGENVNSFSESFPIEFMGPHLLGADLLVDAMFGTGLTRELGADLTELIEVIEEADVQVLAIDLPSGLDANTGEVLGAALHAQKTVTFVAPKPGFYHERGPELCGEIVTVEIGIPIAFVEEALGEGVNE